MALRVLSRAQETLLNKESPTFKNLMVGTSLSLAQAAINANEASITAIKGAGYTNETIKGNATAIAEVGTGLSLAQAAINANEASITAIKGAGYTNETIKGNATAIAELAALVGKRVSIGIAAGVNADEVDISDLDPEITEIVAIFAITSATGAPASKFLLAPTTDYTFEDGVLETVTDQSANTLIVVYK